ncbi:GNAT family N-acetyltransferase [Phototrophicus methaneseepsis]|uniref:GNAT family N-acetyltransferase n=1 Tax=Phototrophicus methaneseepsis TaxID=2710758 RepID=A0A7S8ECV7_9CHLR|nr:GNAT family N-acetyltransferase [Phototrophicus methaneseepsis]QPC84413.1 GNAT family N-acetyltransferase [Phototrophicus methaneseepsis]
MQPIEFRIRPPITNEELNPLFSTAWAKHTWADFDPVLKRSLLYVCAYDGDKLVGFVYVAWDGGVHGFILDTTVHADYQRRGIGVELVKRAVEASRGQGIEWIHVDYEPHLEHFYTQCGFKHTLAGLINLKRPWDGF